MTTNTAAVAARESHRETDGQFGYQQLNENPEVILSAPEPVPGRQEIIDMVCLANGEGMRPAMERAFDKVLTPEGEALMCSYQGRRSGFHHHSERLEPESFDELAGLGHTDIDRLIRDGGVAYRHNLNQVAADGVTAERLEVMAGIGKDVRSGTAWEKDALLHADLDDLRAVAEIPEIPRISRYRAVAAALGSEKVDRLERSLAAGLSTKELIEAEDYEPELLAGILEQMPPSMKARTLFVAAKGHSAKSLKLYGQGLSQKFTLEELKATKVKPAALKAMLSATNSNDLQVLVDLHNAGYSKGTEVRSMAAAIGSDDPAELIRARKIVDPEAANKYWVATKYRRGLNTDELKAVATLTKLGYDDPAKVIELGSKIHKTAQWNINRDDGVLIHYAALAKANLDQGAIAAMSRAGIPVDKMPEMKDAEDFWAAGAPFREAYEKDQKRLADQKWIRQASIWEYTEGDYRNF